MTWKELVRTGNDNNDNDNYDDDWLVDWLVGWLVDWFIYIFIDWLIDWLIAYEKLFFFRLSLFLIATNSYFLAWYLSKNVMKGKF